MSRIELSKIEVCDYVFIPEPDDQGKGRFIIVGSFDVLALSILEIDHRRPSQCDHGAFRKHWPSNSRDWTLSCKAGGLQPTTTAR